MSATTALDLIQHEGHRIVVVTYGKPPFNVSCECATCNEVIVDFDMTREEHEELKTNHED